MNNSFTRIDIKTRGLTYKTLWIREQGGRRPGIRYGAYMGQGELHHTYYENGHRHTESSASILGVSDDIAFLDVISSTRMLNCILPIYPSNPKPIAGKSHAAQEKFVNRIITLNIVDYSELICVNYFLVHKGHKIVFLEDQLDEIANMQSLVDVYEPMIFEFIPLANSSQLEIAVIILDQSNTIG